jgi:HK97 family phage prohead protease
MYRGEHGQQTVKGDVFKSYTTDKTVAESFGDDIHEINVKPIDTLGSYQTTGENEYLVPIIKINENGGTSSQTKKRSADMKKNLERRSYDFEVTAESTEKGAVITGRPIVYNSRTNIGLFDEIIESRALANTDLTDVRFLVNHDISKIPLARSRRNNGNSTMQLIPDEKGLSIEVQLDVENNSEARSLYSAVKRGDISGMSFLFSVPKGGDSWENMDTDHPTRHVKSIGSVVEVSAVTFPAYESTEIYARSKEALDNAKLALESAKRSQKQALESESRSELELAKAKFEAIMKVR